MGQGAPGPQGPPGRSGENGWKEFNDTQKTELINKLKAFKEFKGTQGDKGDKSDLTFDFLKKNSMWCSDGNICTIPKTSLFLPKIPGYENSAIQIGDDNNQPSDSNINSLLFVKDNINASIGMGIIPNSRKGFPDTQGSVLGTRIIDGDEWNIYSSGWNNLFSVQGGTGKVKVKGPLYLENGINGKNSILFKANNNDVLSLTPANINIPSNKILQFGEGFFREPSAGQIKYENGQLNIIGAGDMEQARRVRISDILQIGDWKIIPDKKDKHLRFFYCPDNRCNVFHTITPGPVFKYHSEPRPDCCGGGGGEYHKLLCPEGSFVNEFYGGAGAAVDRIGIKCSLGQDLGERGGGGGGPFKSFSDVGFNKIHVKSGSMVDSIQFFAKNAPKERVGGGGGQGPHDLNCGDGLIMGINVRAGSMIDRIGVICGKNV